jgi:LDH2 family malate/lactate/ureidoglycolate dehydrogenase
MPEGWFVNAKTGEAITDPNRTAEGILLPVGGYKGSGLAIMLGLIGGVLNGAAFGRDVIDFNADDASETNTGHFMVAVDIARFATPSSFGAEVDRHMRDLRGSRRLPGADDIRLPGDRRRQCREERLRNGVPLAPALIANLDKLAEDLKITPIRARGN